MPFPSHARLAAALAVVTVVVSVSSGVPDVRAQYVFDAADDPREALQRVWWKRESSFELRGGLSLIAAQWRAAGGFSMDLVTKSVTGRLAGTFRGGIYGEYEADVDEPYDALRLISFLRYNPPRRSSFYLRAGLLERTRLGTGHLVNFYSSQVAWDERTVGVATRTAGRYGEVAAFTDNVLVNGITGARVALRPLAWARDERTQSFTLGFNYVTDLARHEAPFERLTGYNVDVNFAAFASGQIRLIPFVSFAWYTNYGSGLSFGADLESPNFIDLASFRFRFALYYNGAQFIPGYVGTFYGVSNPQARLINSDAYLSEDPEERIEGILLHEALGGNDLVTEFRMLVLEQFELWYFFRRHYGTQRLGEYHLRLFLRGGDRLVLNVGIDRAGLTNFFSVFSELNDETALVFETDYRVLGAFWIYLRARYSFERLEDGPEGAERYLVQRRFEPLTGLRFRF